MILTLFMATVAIIHKYYTFRGRVVNIGQKNLLLLKEEIPEIEYNRYIKHLVYDTKKSTSDTALFYAPNSLVLNWIKNRYSAKIKHLFEVHDASNVTVKILLKNQIESKKAEQKKEQKQLHSLLNPSHTFENFMVGGSNQFAYAAVKSVSEKAGVLYNPLFIHGGVGLGKTHLMQAAGNVFQNQGKIVIYTTVEQFLNDFIRHVRNKSMEKFQDKYRKCDFFQNLIFLLILLIVLLIFSFLLHQVYSYLNSNNEYTNLLFCLFFFYMKLILHYTICIILFLIYEHQHLIFQITKIQKHFFFYINILKLVLLLDLRHPRKLTTSPVIQKFPS